MTIKLTHQRVWSLQREAARQSLFYNDRGNADLAQFWKEVCDLCQGYVDSFHGPPDTTELELPAELSLLRPVNKSNNHVNVLRRK